MDRRGRHLAERTHLLFERAGIGIAGSLLCAILIYVGFLPAGHPGELTMWLVLMAAISVVRMWLAWRFRCSARQASVAHRWLHGYVFATLAAGAAYAYAALALPIGQPEPLRAFLYICLAALIAGSATTYAAVLPVFLAFCLPTLIGLFGHFVLVGGRVDLVYAAGTLLYGSVMIANAWKQNQAIAETLRTRSENLDLIGILGEAKGKAEALNDSLRAEIAERRRIETDLARTVALYQATMDAVDEGILVLDGDRRVVAVNRRFKDLWGIQDDELPSFAPHDRGMAKVLEQITAPEAYLAEYDSETGDASRPHHGLVELKDGRLFERYVVPYRLNDAVIGQVRTVRDVTERIRGERELLRAKEAAEAASRAKSVFLANMSHELRTPLNAIIGFSDIVRQEMFGPLANTRYRDYAKDIHESATLLLSLINDILDISKVETGRLELIDEQLSLPHLISSAIRLVQGRAADADVAITTALPPQLPLLKGDERLCKQMIVNLLTNAVKFTGAGGQVTVSAERAETGALIVGVTDTGIGMRAEDIPRALEPFGQIDGPMTRRHQGTGLGLPLVKALIEAHGGTLEIDSAPARGTTVRLIFPTARLAPRTSTLALPQSSIG